MAPNHVLRFPRTDEEGTSVLVQVASSSAKSKKPLDVDLVGTDGLAPYVASLRQDRVGTLMVKNSPYSQADWIALLTAVLKQEPVEDIETVAAVKDDSITLTIRKRIKGITQRLGAIELSHRPDEEIGLFDWCETSVQTVVETKEALAEATVKAEELERSVGELKAQLEELIQAKKDDEAELLEKFRDLLNEKKVKIREQQRILASASVDSDKLAEVQSSQTLGKGHAVNKSRATKRKTAPAVAAGDDDSSDDGFEKMDVDLATGPVPEDSEQEQQTTEDEDEATASEDDDEPVKPTRKAASKQTAHAVKPPKAGGSSGQGHPKVPKKETPPPTRALPFGRKKAGQPPAKAAPVPAGSETESDDEL